MITYSIEYMVNLPDRPDLDMYKSMIPETIELYVKGPHSLMKFKGGMAENLSGDILYKAKEKSLYTLHPSNHSAVQTSVAALQNSDDKEMRAKKTSEKASLLGLTSTKYVVKDSLEGTETWVWCTPLPNASTSLMVYFLESMTQYKITNMEGLPLQIAFKGKEFNLNILPKSIVKKKISNQLFIIPKDYTISKTG
jgi:hypothetical protein